MVIHARDDSRCAIAAVVLTLATIVSGCASTGASRPRPFPTPAGSAPPTAPATATPEPERVAPPRVDLGDDQALVAAALSFRGTPYRNGGSDPSGFDCSGFTQWVFAQFGIALPREVEQQFKVGEKIKQDDLQPGDLVFFQTVSHGASHVGIFIADDQFVHAPSSRGVVRVEYITSTYWGRRFIGARRIPRENVEPQPEITAARPRPFPGQPQTAGTR
jgi:cell wall-associated NlpC family hydrolase